MSAKLTRHEHDIVARVLNGETYSSIGRKYGVDKTVIIRFAQRRGITNGVSVGGQRKNHETNPPALKAPAHKSLRDWFAGQALSGFLMQPFDASIEELGETWERALERIPRAAYAYADAMLAERAKGAGQ